jgi:tRNA(fMet)-specific endonuclease VapC
VKLLLDANVLVCALNDTGGVRGHLNEAQASGAKILTSTVVVGELSFGASASGRPEQNHARLRAMLAKMEVVPFTEPAAQRFGDIKAFLRKRGFTKGDADLQIAATAIVEDATLVTDDQALLDGSIPNLRTENWVGRGKGGK